MCAALIHLQKVRASFDSYFPLITRWVSLEYKVSLEVIFKPIVLKIPYIPTTLLALPQIINDPSLFKFNIISQVSAPKLFS